MDSTTTLLKQSKVLSKKLDKLVYPNTVFVYNVFNYVWEGWKAYISNFAIPTKQKKKYLLLGINPGPHGMVQTGIPFGNISTVIHYLQLQYTVNQPTQIHIKRPVAGLQHKQEEQSGKRVWAYIQKLFPSPKDFFKKAFILNFCPLAFFDKKNASNLTPDHTLLKKNENIKIVETLCKEHLRIYCNVLHITDILAIGRYSYNIVQSLLKDNKFDIDNNDVHYISHPSPLNPNHKKFDIDMKNYFQ